MPLVTLASYDLSITYDKYYQTPRVWLFGYDEVPVSTRSAPVSTDAYLSTPKAPEYPVITHEHLST